MIDGKKITKLMTGTGSLNEPACTTGKCLLPVYSKTKTGYVKVCSNYRDFPEIGVGYSLSITLSDGKLVEKKDVKLPIGSKVCEKYGPYPAGSTKITLTPLINHKKQNGEGGKAWTRNVLIPEAGEVEAKFTFVETDTWDSVSTTRINGLVAEHRQRFLIFINKVEEDTGHQFRVANGLRTADEQDRLYCNSRAKEKYCKDLKLTNGDGAWRTNAKRWESYHNYGLAVDIYRFVGSNNELTNPDANTDTVASALDLTWGNSFDDPDPPHFQYGSQTIAELKKLYGKD